MKMCKLFDSFKLNDDTRNTINEIIIINMRRRDNEEENIDKRTKQNESEQ